jgi:hypothetical protein
MLKAEIEAQSAERKAHGESFYRSFGHSCFRFNRRNSL